MLDELPARDAERHAARRAVVQPNRPTACAGRHPSPATGDRTLDGDGLLTAADLCTVRQPHRHTLVAGPVIHLAPPSPGLHGSAVCIRWTPLADAVNHHHRYQHRAVYPLVAGWIIAAGALNVHRCNHWLSRHTVSTVSDLNVRLPRRQRAAAFIRPLPSRPRGLSRRRSNVLRAVDPVVPCAA